MAQVSNFVKTSVSGVLQLRDGSGPPQVLEAPFYKGDLKISPLRDTLQEDVKIKANGRHITATTGDRYYPTISFSAYFSSLIGASTTVPGSLVEMMFGIGAYGPTGSSPALSTSSTVNTLYTTDFKVTVEGNSFGDTETILCRDVRWSVEDMAHAMDGNSLSIKGEILGSITITNNTNSFTIDEV